MMLTAVPAFAAHDPATGQWRAVDGPELASSLLLTADGRFRYILSYGALDEHADGRWNRTGTLISLTTQPEPKPSTILLDSMSTTDRDAAALSLIVTGPNDPADQGLAGIDFRIECDSGDPIEGYTQQDGWQISTLEGRTPRWIQLFERIHGTQSDRIPIPAGTRAIRFRFQANDFGIADFRAAPVTVEGDRLTLTHRMGILHYVRVKTEE